MSVERILIVEDDGIVAGDIQASLKRLGYDALAAASSGEEAIAAAEKLRPDLVMMDIHLKGEMDGVEAAAQIRNRFDVPVIYLTAYTDQETVHRANSTAPLGYIHKPFDDNALHAAVEAGLSRRRIERQLEEGRRWFETTLDCIGDGVIAADAAGRITYMNAPAEAFTAWKQGEAVGRHLSDVLVTIDEDTGERIECPGLWTLREGIPSGESSISMMIVSRDSIRKPVGVTASPIRARADAIDGIVVVLRDITARRLMEKQMVSQQKIDAVGKLSSSIAREFANILNVITGYASSLADTLTPSTRPHEEAARILEAAQHGTDLTRRILHIARASDAAGHVALQPVSIQHVIEETLKLVEDAFARQRIQVKTSVSPRLPSVMADGEHLIDVMMDLLLNIAEWMPDGGTIRIGVRPRVIKRPDSHLNPKARPGAYAVILIRDDGQGFPKELIERVFEPFFMRGKTGTVSLGLSVVNSAIIAYGGWIKVKSKRNAGTTFHICIPIAESQGREGAKGGRSAASSVLVVDDDRELAQQTRDHLRAEGYRVHVETSAAAGLSYLKAHAADLDICLADAVMADADISVLFAQMLDAKPSLALIVMCGFSRDYVRRFVPQGSWLFLQKPFDREALLSMIKRALGQTAAIAGGREGGSSPA